MSIYFLPQQYKMHAFGSNQLLSFESSAVRGKQYKIPIGNFDS